MAAECKTCHRPIWWVTTAATGKRMPLDVQPVGTGNVRVTRGREGPTAEVLGPAAAADMRAQGMALFMSHYEDVPAG